MAIKPRQPVAAQGAEGSVRTSTTVTRSGYNFGEQYEPVVRDTEQKIEVPLFATSPAYVKVSASVTKQPRAYESVRVQVDVSLPCYPEGTEIERAYDICSQWVNQKIQDELSFAYGREEVEQGTQ